MMEFAYLADFLWYVYIYKRETDKVGEIETEREWMMESECFGGL